MTTRSKRDLLTAEEKQRPTSEQIKYIEERAKREVAEQEFNKQSLELLEKRQHLQETEISTPTNDIVNRAPSVPRTAEEVYTSSKATQKYTGQHDSDETAGRIYSANVHLGEGIADTFVVPDIEDFDPISRTTPSSTEQDIAEVTKELQRTLEEAAHNSKELREEIAKDTRDKVPQIPRVYDVVRAAPTIAEEFPHLTFVGNGDSETEVFDSDTSVTSVTSEDIYSEDIWVQIGRYVSDTPA